MDGKDERHTGNLQTVYEDDEEFNGSSAEPPTVEATPRGPYQREIERLTRQLIEREQQVKQQESYSYSMPHQSNLALQTLLSPHGYPALKT
jgi:hypothetical protein